MAHKAEHAVDLETGGVVAVTVAAGDAGDTATILETLPQAGEHIASSAGSLYGRDSTYTSLRLMLPG